MRIPWSPLLHAASLGAVVWLVFETKRLAELAGSREVELRAQNERLAGESAAHRAASAEAARLAGELATAATQLQGMTAVLEERTEQFRKSHAASVEAQRRSMEPMPDGVRTCLQALHECLRAEGFANQRFVRARSLDAEGLHDAELFVLGADGLGVTYLMAGRVTAELDRGKGRFELRFFDGHRIAGGEEAQLPPDGMPLVFQPIDGRLFEQRLPYLVRANGVYPGDVRPQRPPTDVDPSTRLQWLDRFDTLLEAAGTPQRLRVNRFRGMADGCFLEVELIGTDDHHRLLSSAHCARLAVEVDSKANVVSLLLRDGVLRNGGEESTISAEGHRMLLPKLDPKKASDLMFGMVVTR